MKKTFIPNWYEDRKSEIGIKRLKLCIKIVLIINIILVGFILNTSKEVKNIEKQIAGENKTINKIQTVKKDTIIMEKYKEVSKFFEDNKFTYKNFNITKDNIEIDFEVNSYEGYINMIREIEAHYSIKKLIPNIKEENNINFKVIL